MLYKKTCDNPWCYRILVRNFCKILSNMLKDLFSIIMLKHIQCNELLALLFLIFCLVVEALLQV